MADRKSWDVSQLRKYDIQLDEIPRLNVRDPKVDEFIAENKPVVITDTKLVAPTVRWDLDYLEQNIGNGDFSVFLSRNHKFKYYDDKKIPPTSGDSRLDFTPPTRRVDMRFQDFASRLRQFRRGDERVLIEDCNKEENVAVTGAAAASCLKRRF